MSTIDVYNQKNEKVSELELDDAVFGGDVKEHLLYAAVRYQMAKRRAGTHKVKERGEVRGGGKKPFRQKGTGRARAGSSRVVHWRGGGVVHGPRPRTHNLKMNKKMRKAALCSALATRLAAGDILVLDAISFDNVKTKQVVEMMGGFGFKDALLVLAESNENVELSARNLAGVKVIQSAGVNVYDILDHSKLIVTADAISSLQQRLQG